MSLSRYLSLALLLVLTALPLAAQAEPQAAEEGSGDDGVFFESVDVSVVNVDVFVTDKKGNPITGLTKDDFLIFESKRPVTVSNFYAVEDGTPVAGAPLPVTADERPLAPSRPDLPYIPEAQRLNLIIYVDNFNIRPFNRNRVFSALREFLNDYVTPNDRVMLVSYDRSLHVRHPFTTDSKLIANALFGLEKLTGFAVHHDSEWRDLVREINESSSVGEVEYRVKQYAESRQNDLLFTIDALKELIGTLNGLEGRKALVYVSDGLPMSPGEELFQALMMKYGETYVMSMARDYHLGSRFNRLAAAANEARVVFYTIDAGGLRTSLTSSVEFAGSTSPGQSSYIDSGYINNIQAPLRFLADRTGGRAIVNTNDAGPGLEKVAADFRSYYSLGYSPVHAGDGRYYEIEVEVKDGKSRGYEVRHREGYRDKTLYKRMSDTTTASLMYGFYDNPMNVAIRVGGASPADKRGQYDVDLMVEIPIGRMVLVPQQGTHLGRLKLFFSAMDEEGDMSDVSEIPIEVRIPDEQVELARSQLYRYAARLRMRSGGHRVAVGVRDEIGATNSFVIETLKVGS